MERSETCFNGAAVCACGGAAVEECSRVGVLLLVPRAVEFWCFVEPVSMEQQFVLRWRTVAASEFFGSCLVRWRSGASWELIGALKLLNTQQR
ncbi:hypothetical protein RIF29_21476 [Crotalaria pallida]|uniref:Uncharacterized protein n=1 Tax=Crotalaria pallida TaxID=3830 RepID=A0AAN9F7E7_CROPI